MYFVPNTFIKKFGLLNSSCVRAYGLTGVTLLLFVELRLIGGILLLVLRLVIGVESYIAMLLRLCRIFGGRGSERTDWHRKRGGYRGTR